MSRHPNDSLGAFATQFQVQAEAMLKVVDPSAAQTLKSSKKETFNIEIESVVDGIRIKGDMIVIRFKDNMSEAYFLNIWESDIGELIGEYLEDKFNKLKEFRGVKTEFLPISTNIYQKTLHSLIGKATTRGPKVHSSPAAQRQTLSPQKATPTQKKLDTVLKAMPNDNFIQSLADQYKRKKRLTTNQQKALQKIYDRVTNPTPVDPNLKGRLDALVAMMPKDRFVKSLADQYARRGDLSPKQMAAVERIEQEIAKGGYEGRIEALLKNPKIKGRRKSLLNSFKEQLLNGRRLSQRQKELIGEYEQL